MFTEQVSGENSGPSPETASPAQNVLLLRALSAPPLDALLTAAQRGEVADALANAVDWLNPKDNSSYYDFAGKITRSAELMGIEKSAFVVAALKEPTLFCQNPETLDGNMTRGAALMGIDKAAFVVAALKEPHMFGRNPVTLNDNVTRSAELTGIERAAFVAAALKQRPLFYQSPETIAGHARWAQEMARRGLLPSETMPFLLKAPQFLCISDDNFVLRILFAGAAGKGSQDNFNLLTQSRKSVERDLVAALGFDPARVSVARGSGDEDDPAHMRATALRGLIRAGLLKGYKLAENVKTSSAPPELEMDP